MVEVLEKADSTVYNYSKKIKRWKRSYIFLTIVVMIFGMSLIIWPEISEEILCYIFGAVLLVVGGIRILSYFQRGISALWHRYELPLGLLDALLGLYFLTCPINVMLILPIIVGIIIMIDSVFHLQTALELRAMSVQRWWCVLLLSIISIFVAAGLIGNPFKGSRILMIYVGVCLVVDGIQSLYFIHRVAKDVRKLMPIDVDYVEME